ncbi:MAG TPA: hypothetical protein VER32_08850 [Pyrinomonadaceae bacterium]|nr:hypothetical protein [Pyrinomonadaceae bacterium]
MKPIRKIHGELLSRYESELAELKSFIRELKARVAEHGTEPEHYAEDLSEAEHNVTYYEGEIARLRAEGGGYGGGGHTTPPHTSMPGVGSLIVSAISFAAGVLIGSSLRTRRGDTDRGDGAEGR